MPSKMKPFYEDVQAHYDLSDEFYELFLDPTRMYSCAFFREESMSLEAAQLAKVDLSLGKCDLSAGQTLLDVGCGWGTTALVAARDYGVKAIGLTLSKNQQRYATERAKELGLDSQVEFRLQGWEEFTDSVDRIVSIGAFEHFRTERHQPFLEKCRSLLPDDGSMMLHTIVLSSLATIKALGKEITAEDVTFAKFIGKEIFPGGQLCMPEQFERLAIASGFDMTHSEALRLHYARTLDIWAENLQASKTEAIEITSDEVYERYMKYLTGCAHQFREGKIDVVQFTLRCK